MIVGACGDWCTTAEVQARPGNAGLADATVAEAIDVASDLLFRLAGHRWPGVCERTVRPVSRPYSGEPVWWWAQDTSPGSGSWWEAVGWRSTWGWCSCNERRLTGAQGLPSIDLGGGPIVEIVTVMLDGAVVDPTSYRVDDDRWLTRTPVAGSRVNAGWPCCQRLDLPDTEPDTFSVQFTFGGLPPASGHAAAVALAGELARLWDDGDGDCRLDPSVTQVTREGITLDIESVAESGRESGFGLAEVRMFLEAVNPHGRQRRARVVNPDRIKTVVRTGGTTSGS